MFVGRTVETTNRFWRKKVLSCVSVVVRSKSLLGSKSKTCWNFLHFCRLTQSMPATEVTTFFPLSLFYPCHESRQNFIWSHQFNTTTGAGFNRSTEHETKQTLRTARRMANTQHNRVWEGWVKMLWNILHDEYQIRIGCYHISKCIGESIISAHNIPTVFNPFFSRVIVIFPIHSVVVPTYTLFSATKWA